MIGVINMNTCFTDLIKASTARADHVTDHVFGLLLTNLNLSCDMDQSQESAWYLYIYEERHHRAKGGSCTSPDLYLNIRGSADRQHVPLSCSHTEASNCTVVSRPS